MRSIAIAIFQDVQALDVAGPQDVFAEANQFVAADEGYEISLIGATREPLRASNGMALLADGTFRIRFVTSIPPWWQAGRHYLTLRPSPT